MCQNSVLPRQQICSGTMQETQIYVLSHISNISVEFPAALKCREIANISMFSLGEEILDLHSDLRYCKL